MNKYLLILLACVLMAIGCVTRQQIDYGTQIDYGQWWKNTPVDENYYFVAGGHAPTRQEASAAARAEMAMSIRVKVDSFIFSEMYLNNTKTDFKGVERARVKSGETLRYLSIAAVRKTDEGYLALARMPRRPVDKILDGLPFKWIPPSTGEIVRSAIVPGWGQLEKNQTRKGFTILGSQLAVSGGVLIINFLKASSHQDYLLAQTRKARQVYWEREENYKLVMIGTLVAWSAVYLYNLADVSTAEKKVDLGDKPVSVDFNYPDIRLVYRSP